MKNHFLILTLLSLSTPGISKSSELSQSIDSVYVYRPDLGVFLLNIRNHSNKDVTCKSIVATLNHRVKGECLSLENETYKINMKQTELKSASSITLQDFGKIEIQKAKNEGKEICGILLFTYDCNPNNRI